MIKVGYEPELHRSAAYDDTLNLIGMCHARQKDGVWTISHTGVDSIFAGQGIAGQLVQCLADAAREAGAKIESNCSYATHWFETHEEYQDLLK
ncbi:MAG: N-acetyltransferase [Clostridia bacterium]|nr:N-acetyltransferase [Clostridia bacterium]